MGKAFTWLLLILLSAASVWQWSVVLTLDDAKRGVRMIDDPDWANGGDEPEPVLPPIPDDPDIIGTDV